MEEEDLDVGDDTDERDTQEIGKCPVSLFRWAYPCFIVFPGDGPEQYETSARWSRPKLRPVDSNTDSLVFQQLDLDHTVGKT